MKKIKIIFILSVLLFLILIINCSNFKNNTVFNYSDGSGNLYIITEESFEYKPVDIENSSSGMYSGGSYFKYELQKEEFNLLKIYFEKAVNNKKDHTANREKMSGMIVVRKNDKESSYILTPLSKDKIRLEVLLFEMKNR